MGNVTIYGELIQGIVSFVFKRQTRSAKLPFMGTEVTEYGGYIYLADFIYVMLFSGDWLSVMG
jgi:hypothetical protein